MLSSGWHVVNSVIISWAKYCALHSEYCPLQISKRSQASIMARSMEIWIRLPGFESLLYCCQLHELGQVAQYICTTISLLIKWEDEYFHVGLWGLNSIIKVNFLINDCPIVGVLEITVDLSLECRMWVFDDGINQELC